MQLVAVDCRRARSCGDLIALISDALSAQPHQRALNLDGLYDVFKEQPVTHLLLRGVRLEAAEFDPVETVARAANVTVVCR
ncbi:hypothetical protein CCICO_03200 [Corynebacterium ciconiae DSM 44920]|uniref:hypothetical protein n=1 Tax=Corynebacterium ciconiae TaxID=227319 RepID=UPI00035C9F5A|nr:hypothetical protein [Corynebacterium ciconiae]WKD60683.1 hypothetical protein CCICO_03200 [Corynebacterium ciconiae DSM 44920]